MKKLLICFLLSTVFLTGCSFNDSKDSKKSIDDDSNKTISESSNDISKSDKLDQDSINSSKENNTDQDSTSAAEENNTDQDSTSSAEEINNIDESIKNYIVNEQKEIPESQRIKWSERFLNQLNIEDKYNQYLLSGGNKNDLKEFANYLTLNASAPDNWKELFEEDLYDKYGEKVTRLEHLQDGLYQAYIEKDGQEIPYVVVSSKTGYFHS